MCSLWKTEMKAVKRTEAIPHSSLKQENQRTFLESLADYRLIRQNVALKAVTQQQTEGMLMNLND